MNELELKVYDGFASELGKVLPHTRTSPVPDNDVKIKTAQEILKRCDDAFHTKGCKTCAAKARICALNFHGRQMREKETDATLNKIADNSAARREERTHSEEEDAAIRKDREARKARHARKQQDADAIVRQVIRRIYEESVGECDLRGYGFTLDQ